MVQSNTVIPSDAHILGEARAEARKVLALSSAFMVMPANEQKDIYKSLVNDYVGQRRSKLGLSKSMATDSGKEMGYSGYKAGFADDTKAFNDLVESVDFPKFVADLLKAVFDANLKVMKTQTDSYIKLMKEATKSSADFLKQVKDDDTFATLAENKGDKYNVTTEKSPDGGQKLSLVTPEGEKHDLEDATVKKDILEAKINMAKEHRAALREVLLMGVTRLVVEKGEIEAGVDFSIKATRASTAHHDDQNINVSSLNTSFGGGIGEIFGGPSASLQVTNTNIQVNTSDKKATDDLSATLHGKVKIQFKTDYFKLDNFLTMYQDGGTAALKPGGQGGPGQLLAPPK